MFDYTHYTGNLCAIFTYSVHSRHPHGIHYTLWDNLEIRSFHRWENPQLANALSLFFSSSLLPFTVCMSPVLLLVTYIVGIFIQWLFSAPLSTDFPRFDFRFSVLLMMMPWWHTHTHTQSYNFETSNFKLGSKCITITTYVNWTEETI